MHFPTKQFKIMVIDFFLFHKRKKKNPHFVWLFSPPFCVTSNSHCPLRLQRISQSIQCSFAGPALHSLTQPWSGACPACSRSQPLRGLSQDCLAQVPRTQLKPASTWGHRQILPQVLHLQIFSYHLSLPSDFSHSGQIEWFLIYKLRVLHNFISC